MTSRCQGYNDTVLMIDGDPFKDANDRHGHSEDDRRLQPGAQGLLDGLRACHVVAR